MKLTYTEKNGHLYPNLTVEAPSTTPLGRYGRARLAYLKESRPAMYSELLMTGRLQSHLHETERQMQQRIDSGMKQVQQSHQNEIPDKASDPLGWTGWMNNMKSRLEEVAMSELVVGG